MYDWAELDGGVGTENLGTWCMSEDKQEAMKFLGCDEKYNNCHASDFEILAEWERILPFCAGMGSVALYQKQLSLLGLDERKKHKDICDFWRDGNQKLDKKTSLYFAKKYQEIVKKQGIDVFESMMNISRENETSNPRFLNGFEELCERILSALEHGAVLRFDTSELSYARPDRYHAELFWQKLLRGEKLNEEETFVLRLQVLIEVLLCLKERKIPAILHFASSNSVLREQTISYLQSRHLMAGEIRFAISLGEPAETFSPLCRQSNAELRILPELLLRPSDFGTSLVPSLQRLMAEFPIGGLRYGGLVTDSFSMALAAREVLSDTLDWILSNHQFCDEKRQEILNTVFCS